MNRRLQAIRQRQERLIARAAAQRGEIAATFSGWRQPLRIADEVTATIRRLRFHPVLAAVGQSLLLTVAPRYRSLFMWAGRAFVGWEVYRTVRRLMPQVRTSEEQPAVTDVDAERVD
jgi:hypothetical protein